LRRLEIMIFIWNINFVLQTCRSKEGCIASLTSITVFSCAHIKRVFKAFLTLRLSSKAITLCTIKTLEWASICQCKDFIKNQRIVIYNINNVKSVYLINLMLSSLKNSALIWKIRTFISDPKLNSSVVVALHPVEFNEHSTHRFYFYAFNSLATTTMNYKMLHSFTHSFKVQPFFSNWKPSFPGEDGSERTSDPY